MLANRRGFNPIHVGALPPQCAALNNVSVAVEEMAVEAALTGDPTLVFHAIALRPAHRRRALAWPRSRRWSRRCSGRTRPYLPQFKNIKI